jgi:hypothetical protein
MRKNFEAATERWPDAHVHGLCVLREEGSGWYTHHIPFREPDKKVGEILTEDGFAQLLFSLPYSLDSVLPPFPNRLGNGFNLVNLDRYRLLKRQIERRHATDFLGPQAYHEDSTYSGVPSLGD